MGHEVKAISDLFLSKLVGCGNKWQAWWQHMSLASIMQLP